MHGLISCGGGRGEHKLADGDFPTCIAMRIMSGSGGRPVLRGPDHSIPTGRNDHATNAGKCERAVGTLPGDDSTNVHVTISAKDQKNEEKGKGPKNPRAES